MTFIQRLFLHQLHRAPIYSDDAVHDLHMLVTHGYALVERTHYEDTLCFTITEAGREHLQNLTVEDQVVDLRWRLERARKLYVRTATLSERFDLDRLRFSFLHDTVKLRAAERALSDAEDRADELFLDILSNVLDP